ncbi:MAG: triose-phosphate isomerase [Candidatus Zixiibacteriota bacterium]|nr:MAG: triose-phosphate isomerase [candidate division Zixibacteria bacterium]
MARTILIAGNWKLNPADDAGALELLRQLKNRLAPFTRTEVAVMPPFTMLHLAAQILKDSRLALGAQNLYWEATGAFTGEISAPMLKAAGCKYVIIGHSERRQLFGETDATVARKIPAALQAGLVPVVCVGETLEQRESGQAQAVVHEQVRQALSGLPEAALRTLVIAYEPVWAIGTGRNATPEQAQEMHRFIRDLITDTTSAAVADELRILYGGSVKPDNARDLLGRPDIDGALVGGASLKAETFAAIVESGEIVS